MSETSMWLFPVAVAALVGLFVSARAGLAWTWGICLQQLLILIFSILGFCFLFLPALQVDAKLAEQAAGYCTWAAWILFFGFNIGQRLMLNRFSLELSLLKIQEANAHARWVRLFAWGLPGKYWTAMAQAMGLYAEGKTDEANALIAQWQADPRVPSQARESLVGFTMLGHVMRDDWQAITDSFQQNQQTLAGSKVAIPLQMAARAFAEEHRYTESLACLTMLFATSTRVSTQAVDSCFVPFFALTGACEHLKALFAKSKDYQSLPPYSRLFWLGRSHGARGDVQNAIGLLAQAKEKTPASMEIWHERIDRQLKDQQLIGAGLSQSTAQPAPQALIAEASKLYGRWRLTADTVRPAYAGAGVKVLLASIIVAFILSHPYELFWRVMPLPMRAWSSALQGGIQLWGQLDSHFFSGEWWRIITYMFLHGNTPHLALNAGALYLFGKSVENMYGTPRFCVIFFLAGVLSGWVQLVALPQEPAVGASGAILGIFGAAIAGIYKLKHVLPAQIRKAELKWMLSVAILQVVFDQLVNNIAAATDKSGSGIRIAAFAHMGGIVAGFALGMLLPLRPLTELDVVDIVEPNG
jgi:membrane associated rhomboid family serine protease